MGEDHTRAFGAAAKALRRGLTSRTAAEDILVMQLSFVGVTRSNSKVAGIQDEVKMQEQIVSIIQGCGGNVCLAIRTCFRAGFRTRNTASFCAWHSLPPESSNFTVTQDSSLDIDPEFDACSSMALSYKVERCMYAHAYYLNVLTS